MFYNDALMTVMQGYWMECFKVMLHEAAGRRCGLEFSRRMLNGGIERNAGLNV